MEISERLTDAVNARRKRVSAGPNDLLFPNRNRSRDNTSCAVFKVSLNQRVRSLRLSFTSCARPKRADGINNLKTDL